MSTMFIVRGQDRSTCKDRARHGKTWHACPRYCARKTRCRCADASIGHRHDVPAFLAVRYLRERLGLRDGCGNGGWNQIWSRMRTSIRGTASVERFVRSTDQTARRLQRIVSASAVRRSGVTLSTDLLAPGPEVDRNFRSQFELYFSRDVID